MMSFIPLTQATEESDVNTVGHRGTARGEEPRRMPQKFPWLAAAVALVCGAAAAGIIIMGQTSYKDERAMLRELARSDSGFAVCLTGFQGAKNVSAALRKFVIDPLHADLFVVSPESRTSLQAFEPFEGDVGRDTNIYSYFDNFSIGSVVSIQGNWFDPGGHQFISLMQCHDLIKVAEARRGQRYEGIVMSRLDFMWLQPHPVQKRNAGCWIPCPGNDYGGICDHHASCDRKSAEMYLTGKVASIVDPVLRARIPRNYNHFGSEKHLKFVLDLFRVPVHRSVVAAFRSCKPQSKYAHHCMYVDDINMWGKCSGTELSDSMKLLNISARPHC